MAEQLAFLAAESRLPEGLSYAADFISGALEHELIAGVRSLPLQPFQFGQFEGKRRVASFGWRYDYTMRCLLPSEPFPTWLSSLIEQIEAFGGHGTRIAQVLCTEYETGTGIGWHRDKPQFDRIFGVSLASSCRLRFRRSIGRGWERCTLDAAPRSIYAMEGMARHDWEHSIPPVEAPRYSITLRTLKASPTKLSTGQPDRSDS